MGDVPLDRALDLSYRAMTRALEDVLHRYVVLAECVEACLGAGLPDAEGLESFHAALLGFAPQALALGSEFRAIAVPERLRPFLEEAAAAHAEFFSTFPEMPPWDDEPAEGKLRSAEPGPSVWRRTGTASWTSRPPSSPGTTPCAWPCTPD